MTADAFFAVEMRFAVRADFYRLMSAVTAGYKATLTAYTFFTFKRRVRNAFAVEIFGTCHVFEP